MLSLFDVDNIRVFHRAAVIKIKHMVYWYSYLKIWLNSCLSRYPMDTLKEWDYEVGCACQVDYDNHI